MERERERRGRGRVREKKGVRTKATKHRKQRTKKAGEEKARERKKKRKRNYSKDKQQRKRTLTTTKKVKQDLWQTTTLFSFPLPFFLTTCQGLCTGVRACVRARMCEDTTQAEALHHHESSYRSPAHGVSVGAGRRLLRLSCALVPSRRRPHLRPHPHLGILGVAFSTGDKTVESVSCGGAAFFRVPRAAVGELGTL